MGGDCVTDEAEFRWSDSAHQEEEEQRVITRVRPVHLRRRMSTDRRTMGKNENMAELQPANESIPIPL